MQKIKIAAVLLCSIFLLCFCNSVVAAATIRGIVTEADGAPLPFATVLVKGTGVSTVSNAQGFYQLSLPVGAYTLRCQYIAFGNSEKNLTINTEEEVVTLNFTLTEQSLNMKEVVVKANREDPAYPIIRKTIKRRKFHLAQVQSFQAGVYLKAVFRLRNSPKSFFGFKLNGETKDEFNKGLGLDSNGKGVLYLSEQLTSYYSEAPNKRKVVIHSVRESGNPGGLGVAGLPPMVSFYENNVKVWDDVAPRGLVSPISDNALNYYQYKLLGEYVENGKTIFKIQVTPKRLYEPLLEGTLYIVDEDFAIHSLSLSSNTKNNLEQADTLRIDQIFLPLKADVWVIQNQVLYPVFKVMGFEASGSFVTVYDSQRVNEPVPPGIFDGNIVTAYDKDPTGNDSSFWSSQRVIALEEDERRDYIRKDSLYTRNTDPVLLDSLRRKANRFGIRDLVLTGYRYNSKQYKSQFSTNGLVSMVNYNTVEGLNLAPKLWFNTKLDSSSYLSFHTALRYGFSNTHFNGIVNATYYHAARNWRGRAWRIGADAGKYIFQYNEQGPVDAQYNTFTTLLYRQNYYKIYERYEAALFYNHNLGNGLSWSVRASFQDRKPLENTTTYDWAKGSRRFTGNLPDRLKDFGFEPHKAALVNVSVSYKPGFKYIQYPKYIQPIGSNWPRFTLNYEKGLAGIAGSKTDFDKWRFGINDELSLKLMGSLSYDINVGGFLSSKYVGVPDLKHLMGNQYVLAAPYLQGFQLAPYYQFSNNSKLYGEAHVEYNLQGLLTNKIPLFRQAQWYLILGTNTFYAGADQYYTEAFVSVDKLGYKLFRFLRVDFVHGWDASGKNYNGIRIGINSQLLLGNARKSKWE